MNYYGNQFSGGALYHFKYIKREKRNGKWVYYYDESTNKLQTLRKAQAKQKAFNDRMFEIDWENRRKRDAMRAKYGSPSEMANVTSWYDSRNIKRDSRWLYDEGLLNPLGPFSENRYKGKENAQKLRDIRREIENYKKKHKISSFLDSMASKYADQLVTILNRKR